MQLILISGLSGSGKSVALRILEDIGYYCIDNLPAALLQQVALQAQANGYESVAISVDTRSGPSLQSLPHALEAVHQHGIDARLLFLDATTDTLIRRFSETRRRHPLSQEGLTVPECIERERDLLEPIQLLGHRIDTSQLSANQLRRYVRQFSRFDDDRLTLIFQSFGFKHGVPLDADFVFDVRCLPNPYYDAVLRPLTGLDAPVADFLAADAKVGLMQDDIRQFVQRWLPEFKHDNRSYLTIAIGCTGGQHRSVYLAENLAASFAAHGEQVLLRHRELDAVL